MTIYVDAMINNRWKLRGKIVKNCHMWSDKGKDELLDFAEKIGLKRSWVQVSRSRLIHFDLVEKYRNKAIQDGAIPLERKKAYENMKNITNNK